ncbi:ABC transporter ATP-binding protein [Methylobacter sp. YRD-M1]|uniref:ABC transporter ATP-binding protein n=1 Tax=Methylobacter sp. YRD-M1 TaxID=2911520 RepID=UPI00227C75E2|nr:ABC transporter ATP-binding protein [Methylobacter sp. YRD-M1]WAK01044.1 ABC transporter ATP-binding protein [Methylobacter sp. YRD-M1]
MQPYIQQEEHQFLARLQGLTKLYKRGEVEVEALKQIDLTLNRQEFIFVIGPSGSGKTTLLNLLGCIDVPTSGQLSILGRDIVGLSDNKLADFRNQHIGYIFQNFNLMAVLSAYENVEYPLILNQIDRAERKERALEMLNAVGLYHRRNHRPTQLSGGEQQRVAIARALVKQPAMVLADEPTANLDSHTSNEIINLMLEMQSRYKTSFIFSTHDMQIMQHSDRIIRVKDGVLEMSQEGKKQ